MKKLVLFLAHLPFRFIKKRVLRTKLNLYLNDEEAIKLEYEIKLRKKPDLDNPKTFTEKMNWLKLHNRKDIYSVMVDKDKAKKYVADIIGEEYIIPTYGVYDSYEDIDFNKLPNEFVIKTTHGSGDTMFCKDKKTFDFKVCKKNMKKALAFDTYMESKEWPYKNVPKKIIVEKYLNIDALPEKDLYDYKFYIFNGKVEFFGVHFDRFTEHKTNYYSRDLKFLNFRHKSFYNDPNKENLIPENAKKMVELAETLAKGHPFIRVDFYNYLGHIYFGELTFYPDSGYIKFNDPTKELEYGKLIDLSKVEKYYE